MLKVREKLHEENHACCVLEARAVSVREFTQRGFPVTLHHRMQYYRILTDAAMICDDIACDVIAFYNKLSTIREVRSENNRTALHQTSPHMVF